MSYESMVDHLRGELATGTKRRRRRERRTRRVALTAIVVLAVGAAGILVAARERDNDQRLATTPVDPRLEVCHAFLDYQSAGQRFDQVEAQERRARLEEIGAASGDAELARVARAIATADFTTGAGTGQPFVDAVNGLRARCRALGDPDYTSDIVPAPLPAKPSVDLSVYGTPQLFGAPADVPPIDAVGRNLSPVEVASTQNGAHVASWSTSDGQQRNYCVQTMSDGNISTRCSSSPISNRSSSGRLLVAEGNAGSGPRMSPAFTADESVSFAVLEVGDERYVQQPVFGYLRYTWEDQTRADYVVRAYDTNGVQIYCLARDNRTC